MMQQLTIAITAYRVPVERMQRFIEWNHALIMRFNARLVVVADRPHTWLPAYATCLVYPGPMEIFSLTKTSNYGIRYAGAGVIVKTDVDCVIPRDLMEDFTRVEPGAGVCPVYWMSPGYERLREGQAWPATKGTMALHWNDWRALCGYDERMIGYGWEDGDLYVRARKIAVITRGTEWIYHVAHSDADQNSPGARPDYYGREDGFNPLRRADNTRIVREGGWWANENWGRPERGVDHGETAGA